MSPSSPREFDQALAQHARGELDAAETAYRAILAADPDRIEARHYLGVLRHQRGDSDAGVLLITEALRADPRSGPRWNDLGNILVQREDLANAAAAFRKALAIAPRDAHVWSNLGFTLRRQGNLPDAEESFRTALRIEPNLVPALGNLAELLEHGGRLEEASLLHARAFVQPPLEGKPHKMLAVAYYRLGDRERAAECYRAWLDEDPGNAIALHHLAACGGGDVPGRAADDYVAALFDAMAERFDEKLVAGLSYEGPATIERLLAGQVPAGARFDILDAGCGTGLCAPVLAPIARRLTGVDLSEAMLERARARGGYDELVRGELTGFLASHGKRFDLVVMADTLTYFGQLDGLLDLVAKALRPGGLFAFTTERLMQQDAPASEAGFALQSSGRYAHDRDRLTATLSEAGFLVRRTEEIVLRTEFCKPIHGLALLAAVPD